MCDASRVIRQAWVGRQVWPPSGAHQALKDRVAIAADDDVRAILAAIRIGGHDTSEGRARRLAHHACPIVLWHHRFEYIKDRLINGHIYYLAVALCRLLALNEGQQDAQHGV